MQKIYNSSSYGYVLKVGINIKALSLITLLIREIIYGNVSENVLIFQSLDIIYKTTLEARMIFTGPTSPAGFSGLLFR